MRATYSITEVKREGKRAFLLEVSLTNGIKTSNIYSVTCSSEAEAVEQYKAFSGVIAQGVRRDRKTRREDA